MLPPKANPVGSGPQPVALLMSEGYATKGSTMVWVVCAVTQNHYAISGLRSTEGRVCIHGPAATRVCLDVYGICYHKGGITTKRPMNAEGHAKLAPLLAGPGKAGTPLHWALPQELTPALWRDSPPLTIPCYTFRGLIKFCCQHPCSGSPAAWSLSLRGSDTLFSPLYGYIQTTQRDTWSLYIISNNRTSDL